METTSNVPRGQINSQTNGGKLVAWKGTIRQNIILTIYEQEEFPNEPMNGIRLVFPFRKNFPRQSHDSGESNCSFKKVFSAYINEGT